LVGVRTRRATRHNAFRPGTLRMKSLLRIVVAVLLLNGAAQVLAQTTAATDPRLNPFSGRPSLRTRVGDGVGYRNGYTSLGLQFPLRQAPREFLTFGDARMISTFDGRLGGNFGLGHRIYSDDWDRTFGAYLYGDARHTEYSTMTQVSGGIETLGSWWDWRANFYVPVTDLGTAQAFTPLAAPFVAGNNIFAFGQRRFDQALTGFDTTWSFVVPRVDGLRAFIGGYYFDGSQSRGAPGYRIGIDYQATDFLNLGTSVQGDRLFGDNFLFTTTLSWPGRRRDPRRTPADVPARLTEPVERMEVMVVDQQVREGNYAFTDPRTNAPINVVFVDDDTLPGAGDGTFENPFHDFDEVQAAIQRYDIVFVRDGTYVQPITLLRDMRLLGDGTSHFVSTVQAGNILFPVNTPGAQPTMFGIGGGAAITLDNRNEVSGMYVDGNFVAGSQGIFADAADDFFIHRNFITRTDAEAMELQDIRGINNRVVGNVISNITNDGLQIEIDSDDSAAVLVQGNTITGVGNHAVKLEVADNAQMSATVVGNTIVNPGDNGVQIEHFSTNSSTFVITDNAITKSQGNTTEAGVNIIGASGTVSTLVADNTFTLADGDIEGISATASGNAVVLLIASNNVITGTYDNGIQLVTQDQALLTAVLTNNTFTSASATVNTYSDGIAAESYGTSVLSFTSSGNSFANPNDFGINVLNSCASTLTAVSNGDTFTDNAGNDTKAGIALIANGAPGSNLHATVQNGTFLLNDADIEAITATATNSGSVVLQAVGNTVSGTYDNGFQLIATDQSAITATLLNNSFSGTYDNGYRLESNGAGNLTLALSSNNTFTNMADFGIFGTQTGTGSFFANIDGDHFFDNAGADTDAGIAFTPAGAAGSTFTAIVQNSDFLLRDNDLEAVSLTSGGSATVNLSLLNNTVNAANVAAPTFDNGFQITTNASSNVTLTVIGNTIGNATLGANRNGLRLSANNSSTLNTYFDSNSIRGSGNEGVFLRVAGTATFNGRFFNFQNVVGNGDTERDFDLRVSGGTLNLEFVDAVFNGDYRFDQSGTGVFNIDGDPVIDVPNASVRETNGTININTNVFP